MVNRLVLLTLAVLAGIIPFGVRADYQPKAERVVDNVYQGMPQFRHLYNYDDLRWPNMSRAFTAYESQ
jgi:hypothetical protein